MGNKPKESPLIDVIQRNIVNDVDAVIARIGLHKKPKQITEEQTYKVEAASKVLANTIYELYK